ncbi:SirB2 family protein [Echinimonas agarilytica]|uniref:SirB2 family protein n=1 Tax=Echinimonas agarilytica TaxID=1215918 RepID=A0AA41W5R0_9GAMM|nr:SirB2 family protein [Echinimonas agarilytica]MCM2679190.1 SirB2 family protein [Echinimonas agarilytica]
MYMGFKHLHLTLVVVSILLLIIRFVWLMRGSHLLQKKLFKIMPHVVDTFLLLTAIGMVAMVPWLEQGWLQEKLVLVLAYIVLGFGIFKLATSNVGRIGCFVGAMACVGLIANLARTKVPFLLG